MHKFDPRLWTPTFSRVAAGVAIGLAVAGLISTAAATSAGVLADSFTTQEIARHQRAVEFDDGLTLARQKRAVTALPR